MKRLGLIAAMSKEIELLKGLMSGFEQKQSGAAKFYVGKLDNKELIIVESGIGKVCAACAGVELIKNFSPDYIINTGAAGSISPKFKVMDAIVCERSAYYDVYCGEEEGRVQGFPLYYDGNKTLLSYAQKIGLKKGFIASGDRFVTKQAEAENILRIHHQAEAVDMESAALAQVCYMYQVPFLSVRIISDEVGVENHQAQYDNFWQTAGEQSFVVVKKLLEQIR